MFRFWETYTVYCYRHYDENELQLLANRYKDYITDWEKYHNVKIEENIENFSDFMIENENFFFHDNYDYDFDDSNIQELYLEIKKYM
jgi:hypothetical protein